MTKTLIDAAPNAEVSTPAQTSVSDSAGVILSADPKRKGFTVQNTGTTVIKLTFGSTNPTQTAYHVALSACTAGDDGKGGFYSDEHTVTEVRAISSAAGGTCVVTVFRTGSPDWNQAHDLGLE